MRLTDLARFCVGFTALIVIHTFQNIGMNIGIMPVTGIPLLFVSYGELGAFYINQLRDRI